MNNTLWALLFLLAAIWGASFYAYEIGLESLSFSALVMYRIGGAALFLWILAIIQRWKIPKGKIWIDYAVLGLLNNAIPFTLIAWGQQFIESGLSSILNATTAVFGTLLAPLFFANESLTIPKLLGIIIGLIGVTVAIGVQNLSTLDPRHLGQLAVIAASLSYAFGGIYAKARVKSAPNATALGMLSTGAIAMILLHFITNPFGTLIPNLSGGIASIYLAVVSTAIAYLLFYYVLSKAGISYVTLVTLLIPIFAITLGVVLLEERLEWTAFLGFGLVAIALIFIDGRIFKISRS